ncbi:synaptonemal complex protein 3-like [Manis pentadactyla]|uniref:synaptonemal complex protein 3-like n=1 Tax=Manis pentadactyla TaxID=143292 RepID=UPI00255C9BFC|nr:synaptonemal complex protein 3-like [Manis pentadactyla]
MQELQEQEEKLANLFQEQWKLLQQAGIVQIQKLKKTVNIHELLLKSMEDLEKDHEHLLAVEQDEIREEMDKFKNNILMEIVSTVCLILRTKEGREPWGILFAEIHITITKIMCKRVRAGSCTIVSSAPVNEMTLKKELEPSLYDTHIPSATLKYITVV